MLRVESEKGWWLITHPDHARLAAAFAAHWGNEYFVAPTPRSNVLHGICVHDDGWAARDAHPGITSEGKPSAFSHELVGRYSAFEEIDLTDYLAVRESALDQVEGRCAYAALLVSMHTYNLLAARADRSTIASNDLPLLDAFLERQLVRQNALRARICTNGEFTQSEVSDHSILDNFRLLQGTDNLSLYSCVGYKEVGSLLHPHLTRTGTREHIEVFSASPRHYRLKPYPMDEPLLTFTVPARHVEGSTFSSSAELENKYVSAAIQRLVITISA